MSNTHTPVGKKTDERLEIYTLGRFQVSCGEQKFFDETGRSQKIGELFMYLITYRGKPAAPETILEALWPEQEYTNPRSAINNLTYRLKQKLNTKRMPGARSIISCSFGGYVLNKNLSYWHDAEVFENLCQEARVLAKTEPLLAVEKYRKALALYRGDYLPEGYYSDWVLPVRHYYRRLYVRSVSELLVLQKKQRLFSQIAEDCEKAFLIEQDDENIHLCYMEALLEEGKTAQARAHYEYITSLNYQTLGAKPSQAMQRIYRSIKAKSEKPDLDFTCVQEMLNERDKMEGALLCDQDKFRFLNKLERRRADREDSPVHLGLLTLTGSGFQQPPSAHLQKSMELLQQVLLASLRRGDVISPWNESQFTLLLPGLNLEQAEKVLHRVQEKFKKMCSVKGVTLRKSAHPILPWEYAEYELSCQD